MRTMNLAAGLAVLDGRGGFVANPGFDMPLERRLLAGIHEE